MDLKISGAFTSESIVLSRDSLNMGGSNISQTEGRHALFAAQLSDLHKKVMYCMLGNIQVSVALSSFRCLSPLSCLLILLHCHNSLKGSNWEAFEVGREGINSSGFGFGCHLLDFDFSYLPFPKLWYIEYFWLYGGSLFVKTVQNYKVPFSVAASIAWWL